MIEQQQKLILSPYMEIYELVIPKDNLLRQIKELVDFSFIYNELLDKYCLDNGRNAVPPIRMFKYLLLKSIYDLSDVDVVERSKYDMSFKYFLDMAPEDEVINPSSLTKFRKLRLKDINLLDMLIAKTVQIALDKGIIKSKSIIVDATHTKSRYNQKTPREALQNQSKKLRRTIYEIDETMKDKFPNKNTEDSLEKELRKKKLSISEFLSDDNLKDIYEEFKLDTLDDLYLSIGNGKISPLSVINFIVKDQEVAAPKVVKVTSKNMDADIIVNGIDKVKVNLANCCCPVYGDDIIGYITKGNGITVHRTNCHNLEMLESRTLEVHWNTNVNKRYLTNILIYSNSQDNHMLDLMQTISNMNVSVDGINMMSKVGSILYSASIYVTGLDQLTKLFSNLEKQPYIDHVERLMR